MKFLDTKLHLSSRCGDIDNAKKLIEAYTDVNIKNGNDNTPLHLSSFHGYNDITKALIEAKADVNIGDGTENTPLHLSSIYGRIAIAKALIEANADLNIKNGNDNAPLHLSSRYGRIGIVKALIDASADVNIKNLEDYTALHLSAKNGHTRIVKALINAQAYVNIQNRYGHTALHSSSKNGHTDIVKILIEASAEVNIKNKDGNAALHLSSRNGHIGVTKVLIVANAGVNTQNEAGDTALHLSSMNGRTNVAKALLEANADVNTQNEAGDTALHLSSRNGHIDIAKALIEAGADVNIKNLDNETALHVMLNDLNFIDLTKALDKVDIPNVNIREKNKNTYLHFASLKGNTPFVQRLIECKADPNIKNRQGLKAVHLAALNGHTEIIRKLFNAGAKIDVNDHSEISLTHLILLESAPTTLELVLSDEIYCNALGKSDRTILHLAARLGCHEHMKCLLAIAGIHKGIQLNPKDHLKQTPLHCASEIGNTETVNNLLRAGSELHVLDDTDKSVLHIASIYGHCELVKLFISKGLDPYQVDKSGRNCLHDAVLYRNEDVVRELFNTTDRSKYNMLDSYRKLPKKYLHKYERRSLISRLLHVETSVIEEFPLEEHHSFHADISKCPHVSHVSEMAYLGSVNAIKGHDMSSFIAHVKYEVEEIIRNALPKSNSIEVIGVGSSFEGTKNGLPDELDFIIKLFHVNSSSSGQEGYGKMERDETEVKRLNIFGSYGIWFWEKLMAYWSECQTKSIKSKTTTKIKRRTFEMPLPPQRHPDHKTCTTWIWLYSDGLFNDFPISIDLVPAVETSINETKLRSTWAMTADYVGQKKCHIVPKIPHGNSLLSTSFSVDVINQLGRVSYPTLEVEHLKALDQRIKNVYITAKCLRKPEVCGFKIKIENGEVNMVKAVGEFVTSFRLKSVFLHLVKLFRISELSLGKMILMVYEQLEKCLKQRNLPMVFDPEVNILIGSRLSTEDSLAVTSMMKRFVRALYERDNLTSEMEKDTEEEAKAIELERTAPARYDEEMRIYKVKMKEWNDDDRSRLEKPAQPEKPNKPVLLNSYIFDNLRHVISTTTKGKSAEKDELVPSRERQAKHLIEQSKGDKQGCDDTITNDLTASRMRKKIDFKIIAERFGDRVRKWRSEKEERVFTSEAREDAVGEDRLLSFDMMESRADAEGMICEEEVVYDRRIINDWIVSCQREILK